MKIVKESLATRCEICHQADSFIPEENICARCKDINTRVISLPTKTFALPAFLANRNITTTSDHFNILKTISYISVGTPYILLVFYQFELSICLSTLLMLFGIITTIYGHKKDKNIIGVILSTLVGGLFGIFVVLVIILLITVISVGTLLHFLDKIC